MKQWFLVVCGILTGCASVGKEMVPGSNMLNTAPKTSTELRHPEWGYPNSTRVVSQVPNTTNRTATTSKNVESLEIFLNKHNIAHETIHGKHLMVRLKEQLHFETGSAQLSAQSQQWLKTLGQYLADRDNVDLVIDGHSDSTGTTSFNDSLSVRRAREVEKQILSTNMPRQRVFSRGFGELAPQCSNTTSSGKACNRRVELMLIVSE